MSAAKCETGEVIFNPALFDGDRHPLTADPLPMGEGAHLRCRERI